MRIKTSHQFVKCYAKPVLTRWNGVDIYRPLGQQAETVRQTDRTTTTTVAGQIQIALCWFSTTTGRHKTSTAQHKIPAFIRIHFAILENTLGYSFCRRFITTKQQHHSLIFWTQFLLTFGAPFLVQANRPIAGSKWHNIPTILSERANKWSLNSSSSPLDTSFARILQLIRYDQSTNHHWMSKKESKLFANCRV